MKTNVIYNEDCLEGMKKLPDNSVDLVITDPPYKITSRGNFGSTGGMLKKKISMNGRVFSNNDIGITDWIGEVYRILKDGSHCYIMTNHTNLKKYLNEIEKAGFSFIKNLIWNKGNKIMGQYYMSQYEYIIFCRKGKGVAINDCGTSDILTVLNNKTKDNNGDNLHDTEKPVGLANILIENSSQKGDVVVDPFVGVGWVAISSYLKQRKFICWEIDEGYYNSSLRRLGKIDKRFLKKLPEEEKPAQQQLF